MRLMTFFALGLIPVELAVFGWALRYWRNRNVPCTPLWALLPALAGLLVTSAGDLAGKPGRVSCVLGIANLLWFAFLLGRGRFSWPTAGILAMLLLPLLAAVVLPHYPSSELHLIGCTLCAILSVSAAVGARRSPGGKLFAAGLPALMAFFVCWGLRGVDYVLKSREFGWVVSALAPLSAVSLALLTAALARSVPQADPLPALAPAPVRRCRNATALVVIGALLPLFFIAAMVFFNGKYSWYNDFISHSGRVFLKGSRPNYLSAWLLTTGLTGSAAVCGWYFVERFRWGRGAMWQRWAIMIFGVIGAAGLAGIGAAPFDRHPGLHNFFTLCSVPLGIAILLAGFTPDDCFGRRGEKAIWLVFAGFILACVAALSYLTHLKQGGLPFRPTGPVIQKITVLGFYVYMLGQVIAYAINARRSLRQSEPERDG